MKITQWLALRFTFISGLTICAILIFVYWITSGFVHEDFVDRLNQQADIEFLLHTSTDTSQTLSLNALGLINPSVLITNEHKTVLYQRGDNVVDDSWRMALKKKGTFSARTKDVTTVGRIETWENNVFYIFVSEQDVFGQRKLDFLLQGLAIGWFVSIALSYYTGLYFSRIALSPVKRVVHEVSRIGEDNLRHRLSLEDPKALENPDEIEELVIMFNALLDRLEVAFIAQKQFVQNASHELKTPMTAIMAEVELALGKSRSPEEYQRVLRLVEQETEHLANTTQGLLTLTRLEQTTTDLERKRINLMALVKDVIDEFKSIHTGRIIVEEFAIDDPIVIGNEVLLRMTINNVLDNALKYSQASIKVVCIEQDQRMLLHVIDHGIGIPRNELNRIRTPLVRASNVSNISGSGLGLALVDRIIRVHHGALDIQSNEGRGTQITITLPLAKD